MNTADVIDFMAYKERSKTPHLPHISDELSKAIETLIKRLKEAEPLKREPRS